MTSSRPAPAITAMWAWDNPVDPALDPRGRGYAPAATDRLVAFARAGGLHEVHVAAPGGPAGAPVDEWLRTTVAALHDAGVAVCAVTGVLDATAAWAAATVALAPVDRLQVVVLPWAPPGDETGDASDPGPGSRPGPAPTAAEVGREVGRAVGRDVLAALAALRSGGTGIAVDAAVPWWFASEVDDDGRPLLSPVVEAADRVTLAAPAARAEGPGGVLELAAPAVEVLVAAGRPFRIGVQADAPGGVVGADQTFWDEGPVALIRECGVVAAALADVPGFGGVAVKDLRSWRRLLGV